MCLRVPETLSLIALSIRFPLALQLAGKLHFYRVPTQSLESNDFHPLAMTFNFLFSSSFFLGHPMAEERAVKYFFTYCPRYCVGFQPKSLKRLTPTLSRISYAKGVFTFKIHLVTLLQRTELRLH